VTEPEILQGGVGNAGAVIRHGDQVVRPSTSHSPTLHALLRHVRERGFDGVPEPRRLDADGREWLTFIAGDVPLFPFPEWSQSNEALASTARLLRQFHDATVGFDPPPGATWNTELADAEGGDVFCHNDVCPENVVYRNGQAVALLDFDFAAPGRREFDLSAFATMCVPLDAPEDATRSGRGNGDPFTRLRVIADAYGLAPGRSELVDLISERAAGGGAFVKRRVDAGIPAFVAMWEATGGQERYDRRRLWFETEREHFLDAVG